MQLFGIEGRYAHALYSAAAKGKTLDSVHKELKELQTRIKTDKAFAAYLASPVVSRKDKNGWVTESYVTRNVTAAQMASLRSSPTASTRPPSSTSSVCGNPCAFMS